jgi:hypothetical protein
MPVNPDTSKPIVPSELRSATAAALRDATIGKARPDWIAVERLVREFVAALREHGMRREATLAEARAIVIQATGDPSSSLLPSVETWALKEFYRR